jgi:hypothetical protein
VISIKPEQDGDYPYRTHAILYGGSIYIKIPPETADHCDLAQLKDETGPERIPMMLLPEDGPHGEYYSIWNQHQQDQNNDEG